MSERKILKEEIEILLSNEQPSIIVPSKTDKDVELIMGFVLERGLVVIYNKKTGVLITVRQMRDKEKKLFEEVLYDKE
ncbi:MAG: hypothetical protein ABH857_03835 [Elusimicrobiota bacterium]